MRNPLKNIVKIQHNNYKKYLDKVIINMKIDVIDKTLKITNNELLYLQNTMNSIKNCCNDSKIHSIKMRN